MKGIFDFSNNSCEYFSGRLNSVNANEVMRYLKVDPKAFPPELLADITKMSPIVFSAAAPIIACRIFDTSKPPFPFDSENVSRILSDCSRGVIFCASLGHEIDRMISKWQIKDMSKAVILDAVASVAVENVCDNFQLKFKNTTPRLSPGYGDFPLSKQLCFEEVLNMSKLGVNINDSYLLSPLKTVTAVFGIKKEQ